jgi:hypothetical protein
MASFGEKIFHFAIKREAPGSTLGKQGLSVNDYVKLSGFARADLNVLPKARLQRCG